MRTYFIHSTAHTIDQTKENVWEKEEKRASWSVCFYSPGACWKAIVKKCMIIVCVLWNFQYFQHGFTSLALSVHSPWKSFVFILPMPLWILLRIRKNITGPLLAWHEADLVVDHLQGTSLNVLRTKVIVWIESTKSIKNTFYIDIYGNSRLSYTPHFC